MTNSNSRPDEFSLIATLFAPLAGEGAFGLTDDAAVIAPSVGHELVITTDMLIEGVDFFATDPPDTIARKALRVNLSDLAAKGAHPVSYLLSLALPANITMAWLEALARGLKSDQGEFDISLLGGDTSSTQGPLTISVTAFGEVPLGKMIRRSGARDGDLVFVTGTIGDSGAGLALLKDGRVEPQHLVERYRLPQPRTAFGVALGELASAALDVSDGLIADLAHIADVSGVAICVEAEKIPLSSEMKSMGDESVVLRAATSGDDYEIAFTARAENEAAIMALGPGTDTPVRCIGRVVAGKGVKLLDAKGAEIPVSRAGFRHF